VSITFSRKALQHDGVSPFALQGLRHYFLQFILTNTRMYDIHSVRPEMEGKEVGC
jgi:hypothetical protein